MLWYWTTFSEQGGTPTLLLRRRAKANCYSVRLPERPGGLDTRGERAVLSVDGRRVRTRAGRACVGRHRGLVRATAPNAVRSNALR